MKTKIYREGDIGAALCDKCKGRVSTTYVRRDVPLSDGSDVVKAILVAACDGCGQVVMMPHQSVHRVQKVVQKQRMPIEARVPMHLKDMMAMVVSELHQNEAFEQQVYRYYIHRWSEQGIPSGRVKKYRNDPLFFGKADTRVSLKIANADVVVGLLCKQAELINTSTDLVKTIALAAFDDVVEKANSQAKKALSALAAAYN